MVVLRLSVSPAARLNSWGVDVVIAYWWFFDYQQKKHFLFIPIIKRYWCSVKRAAHAPNTQVGTCYIQRLSTKTTSLSSTKSSLSCTAMIIITIIAIITTNIICNQNHTHHGPTSNHSNHLAAAGWMVNVGIMIALTNLLPVPVNKTPIWSFNSSTSFIIRAIMKIILKWSLINL